MEFKMFVIFGKFYVNFTFFLFLEFLCAFHDFCNFWKFLHNFHIFSNFFRNCYVIFLMLMISHDFLSLFCDCFFIVL